MEPRANRILRWIKHTIFFAKRGEQHLGCPDVVLPDEEAQYFTVLALSSWSHSHQGSKWQNHARF